MSYLSSCALVYQEVDKMFLALAKSENNLSTNRENYINDLERYIR